MKDIAQRLSDTRSEYQFLQRLMQRSVSRMDALSDILYDLTVELELEAGQGDTEERNIE